MTPSRPPSPTRYQLIDRWSAVHLSVWTLAGGLAYQAHRRRRWSLQRTVLTSVALAFAWEVVEITLGSLLWGDVETPWNRWISDPLTAVIGPPLGWKLTRALEARLG